MGKKRPWCERVESKQQELTVEDKDVWSHTPVMFWGGILCLISFTSSITVIVVNVFLFVRDLIKESSDPLDPGFFEVALPIIGIGVGACVIAFALGFSLSYWQRQRVKRRLITIRCQRCPKCFYDLSNRPHDDEICPECGVIAPRRECVRLWCKLLRSPF